uniref:Uncharacterized protein n=1 Tax=Lepeophtheirus salmonis TaxID=72036 RepID=A0A0K2V852_LEPSM
MEVTLCGESNFQCFWRICSAQLIKLRECSI